MAGEDKRIDELALKSTPTGSDLLIGEDANTHEYFRLTLASLIAAGVVYPVTSVASRTGDVVLTKNDVGLTNVDNTSDANKPVSTATQTALTSKVDKVSGKGLSTNDYTTAEQTKLAGIAAGATANSTDAQLRDRSTHTGTQAISTVSGLQTALDGKEPTVTPGTSTQYYRGDKTFQTLDKTAVGLANVDNVSDANKPVSSATQTALNAKQATLVSGTNIKTINGTTVLGSGDIVVSGSSADATTTSKGAVQLAGGLGGVNSTAASPQLKDIIKVFNVLDYGASTGAADNSTYFLAAFTAANAAGGGIVNVPAGTFIFTNAITIPSNVWVYGAGLSASILSTSMSASNNRGILNVSTGSNIKMSGIGFVANGGTAGFNSYGHTDLLIEDCGFTGTSTTSSGGILNYVGNSGAATRTWINRCRFFDITTQNARTICMSPKNGNHVEDLKVTNCHFRNNGGPCVSLNTSGPAPSPGVTPVPSSVGYARRVLIQGNSAYNVLQGNVTGDVTTGSLLLAGISAVNTCFDIIVDSNNFTNTNTAVVSGGMAFVYGCYGLVISNNTGRGVFVPGSGTVNQGPFVSPGRVGNPCVNISIINNRITGFNSPWDADSMVNCNVSGNTVYQCGNPFFLGYANQEHVNIHDNVFHNSVTYDTQQNQGFSFSGSAAPIKCRVQDNVIIDDRGITAPTSLTATLTSGGSLAVGTTQYYVVTALDGYGETLKSTEVSVTPTSGNQTAKLTFTRMIGAVQYNIYRSITSGSYGTSSLIGTFYYAYGGPASNNFFNDTGLTAGTGSPPSSSTVRQPIMATGLKLFGGSDFSDVVFTGNRFFLPHSTFTAILTKETGNEITPREMYNNEFHDQTGIVFDNHVQLDLQDVTVSTAGPLTANVGSNVTASGTYTAPTPATTVTKPPQRFRIINRTTSTVTLQFPNPVGTVINLTVLSGEVITFRQVTTSGYTAESGNKGLAQLDARYGQLASANTWALAQTFSVSPQVPTATAGDNTLNAASTAFVSAAVANAVTGALSFKGSTDASTNPSYPSAKKGDVYVVTVAGRIGGASGPKVEIGDEYFATADNAGGTQTAVGTSWAILQANLDGALLSANNLSDVASISAARTNLGLGTAATQNKVAAGVTGVLDATDPTTTNSRTPNGSATGDLTGSYPNPTLANTANVQSIIQTDTIPLIIALG